MTYNKLTQIKFEKIFNYFYKYWDYTSKRNTEYSEIEVLILTTLTFKDLKIE